MSPTGRGHPPHQLGLVVVIEGLAVGVGEVGGPALVLLEPEQGTGEIEQHGGMSHGESLVKGPVRERAAARAIVAGVMSVPEHE